MSILKKLSFNLSDIANFGPQFLRRHLPKITGAELARVKLPRGQPVYLRADESDTATIRQTFSDHQYRTDFNKSCAARVRQRYDDILASGQVPSIIDAGANIGAASIWFAD